MCDGRKVVCTPCLRDRGVTMETVKYCVECNLNLCKSCLRVHIKQTTKAGQGHVLLGKDELPVWMKTDLELRQCKRHSQNNVTSNCQDHETTCCGACVVLDHSLCENLIEIDEPDGAQEAHLNDDIFDECKETERKIKCLIRDRMKGQKRTRKMTAAALARVREIRQQVNSSLDEIETATVEEINSFCLQHDNKLQRDIKTLEKQLTLLEMETRACSEQVVQEDGNYASVLKRYSGRKTLFQSKQLCEAMQKSAPDTAIGFQINPSFQLFIKTLKSFGEFQRVQGNSSEVLLAVVETRVLTSESEICARNSFATTALRSGKIAVSDCRNKCVYILDESLGDMTTVEIQRPGSDDITELSGREPVAICRIDDGTVAVAVEQDKRILIVDILSSRSVTSSIGLDEYCRGLAYNELYGELYVCCGGGSLLGEGLGHVKVSNISGNILRTFNRTKRGDRLFILPLDVAISNNGSVIFVADKIKGVLALDREGIQLKQFRSQCLEEPRGLCVDMDNHVIVCGFMSNNIIDLGTDLDQPSVLTKEGQCNSCNSISFLPRRSMFAVTCSDSNILTLFKRTGN